MCGVTFNVREAFVGRFGVFTSFIVNSGLISYRSKIDNILVGLCCRCQCPLIQKKLAS